MASMLDIINDALEDLGKKGAADPSAYPEDTAKALRKANQIIGIWNTTKKFSSFERMQTFAVTTSAASYTIGESAGSPTFTVAVGKARP